MEPQKEKIIVGAEALFLKYGFKSITMDDISRELGISKKTLYQYFADKNELVDDTITRHINLKISTCQQIEKEEHNPIEFMLMITHRLSDAREQINQSILFDLKKYFKASWDKLNEFRKDFIYRQMIENLTIGKDQGWYHPDINVKLIARFYIHLVDFMINPDIYASENWEFNQVQFEMMRYHLRGICTEKGMKYLNNKLDQI